MIKNLKGVIGSVFMFLCLFGIKQGTCLVYGEVEVMVYSPKERGYRFTDNIEGIDFDEKNNVLTLENYKGEEIQIKNDGKGGNNNIIINVKGNNEIYAREQCIESSADNGGPKREIVKFGDATTGMPNTGYYAKIGWELWVEGVDVEFTGDGIKYKVTKIAKNAFKNNRKIKEVIIGKNISSIGKRAFANCKKLKLVNIKSKKIVRIGKKAFYKGKRTKVKFKLPKGKKKLYKKLLKIA